MEYLIISGCNNKYILTMIDFIKKYSEKQLDFNKLIIYDYGLNENNLIIPHPLAHEREFVTVPLGEITTFNIKDKKIIILN
jgi:7,8-dihydro-6-hydroxymethylpterin-pyrophosphokinase